MDFNNTDIAKCQYNDKVNKYITNLKYNEYTDTKLKEYTVGYPVGTHKGRKHCDDNSYENVFIDFECYKDENSIFVPYLCRIKSDKMKKVFYGKDCGLKMLKSFKKGSKIYLIAHNAKFDYRFII